MRDSCCAVGVGHSQQRDPVEGEHCWGSEECSPVENIMIIKLSTCTYDVCELLRGATPSLHSLHYARVAYYKVKSLE